MNPFNLNEMTMPKFTAPRIQGSPAQYFGEVKAELKKVKWPTREEVIKMTIMVISISVVVSLLISSLDFIFTKLMELVLK